MGMDVFGKKPTTEEGKYFRNNVWWWRPLATYCVEVAPEVCSACKFWQSNDGHGLDGAASIKLADALQREVDEGRTLTYAARYASRLEMMPNAKCRICAGTGIRKPIPEVGAGDPNAGGLKCNGCSGSGHVRPSETDYPFDVVNVAEFITFLRGCGGFEIC